MNVRLGRRARRWWHPFEIRFDVGQTIPNAIDLFLAIEGISQLALIWGRQNLSILFFRDDDS